MINASYSVTGMSCGHCAQSVTDELMELDGVSEVAVDLEAKIVTVTSENALTDDAIRAAVTEAGYSVAEPAAAQVSAG